jgi:hypothetical protein
LKASVSLTLGPKDDSEVYFSLKEKEEDGEIRQTEISSKQSRNNVKKRDRIPLLCGPIIDTIAYESLHAPNLTSFMKFSNLETLKTPSPSMSCVEKHAPPICDLQGMNA